MLPHASNANPMANPRIPMATPYYLMSPHATPIHPLGHPTPSVPPENHALGDPKQSYQTKQSII